MKMIRKVYTTLLVAFVLVGLISCDSESAANQQKVVNTTAATVNIGRLICGGHLTLAVVEKKFQNQLKSFKLNTIQNHDWNDVVSDLTTGKLAGTFMLSPLAMNLIKEGFPGKIVLVANRNGNSLVLSNKFKTIDELKNRQSIIAVPHKYSQHNVLLHMLLAQRGLDKKHVKIVSMPPRDMIYSLRNGSIDGFVVGVPEGNKAVSSGIGWMAAISPQIWEEHMDHVFLVSNKFISEQREKLQELINNLVRAGDFIERNPHEAAIMGEDYTGSAAAIFEQVLTSPPNWIMYKNHVANTHDIQSMAHKMVDMGLWPTVPSNMVDGYFDMHFATKAQQLLTMH